MKTAYALTIGQQFSEIDKRQYNLVKLFSFIKAVNVRTVIDMRPFTMIENEISNYHKKKLSSLFTQNGVNYLEWGDKNKMFYESLKGKSGVEWRKVVLELLTKPTIEYLTSNQLGFTALLFPRWEGKGNVKGAFCSQIHNEFENDLILSHMIPRFPGRGFDIFTNSNVYDEGYGRFLSVKDDMQIRSEFDNDFYGWDDNQSDINHELRGMNEEAGGSMWSNID